MIELATANFIYVLYRLAVSGPLVKFTTRYLPYYVAVFIMAQLSFIYDNFIFYNYFEADGFLWVDIAEVLIITDATAPKINFLIDLIFFSFRYENTTQ